uniref:G_PROTEIN_RECEP_F1_2 domain-containing protein n=1 Tax=Caenorhabditis tropicalis TaxID=1561998 RepID=A0A1I7TDX3_9PELO
MSEEDFSGNGPEEVQTLLTNSEVDPGLLSNETTTTTLTDIIVKAATTTLAPILIDYRPNPYRIGLLAFKCLLIILLFTLSCTIRKDFLKFFVLFLIIPLFIEAGFDIFTEIHARTAIFGAQQFDWEYFNLSPRENDSVTDWQKHAVESYGQILQKYTTYQVYTRDQLFSIVSYVTGDFVFWSLLFSTTTVFHYAHKAIVRPEQITYDPICSSFFKIQIVPVIFTAIDTLISIYEIPQWSYLIVLFVLRISACVFSFIIFTQAFASLFLFCRRKDEVTKTSPYEHVRNSKIRLFLFLLFTIIIHAITAPYIIWSGLTIASDVGHLLGFNWYLPMHFASEMFPLHLTFFLVRPYAFIFLGLFLLNPYRRRFVKFFCPCCRRH